MLRDALGAPLTLPTEGEVGQPAVGDLWVVSADGQDRGVVMISAVRDLHVLAWPVTLPTSAAAAPAFLITVPDTGDFVAWPDAEFGLALAALDRRLAHVLDDRTTRTIRWAVTEDEPVDSVSTCPAVDTPEAVAAFEAVCSQAWALGDWAWPDNTIGEAALSQDALSDAGVEIAQLAQALGVKPGRASALARGVKVPTPEEVATILSLFPAGTVAGDILEPVDGADAVLLSLPEYKSRVRRLSAERTVPERRARTMVWEQACSRAARQVAHTAPMEAARARVDYALEELMGGT